MSRALILTCALALTTIAFAAPKTFVANDYGAKGDGTTLDTAAIQRSIDAAAKVHGTITLKPGTYLSGSLFLKSGTTLDVPEGATIIGSEKLADYPELPTRVAGIEMTWPAALINARNQHDVTITGHGTIDGDGPIWWKSYPKRKACLIFLTYISGTSRPSAPRKPST
jgi:polygalacturonase